MLVVSRVLLSRYSTTSQIGAIVPWNYPFHNVFNPLVAALYAGNAIVIKVRVTLESHPCTYHSKRKDSISLASRTLARLVSSGSRNVADAGLPGLHVSARTCQTNLQVCTELPGLYIFAKRGSTCSIFLRFRQTN